MSEGVSCTTAPAEPSALIIITHRGTVTTQSGQPDGETSCSKYFFNIKYFRQANLVILISIMKVVVTKLQVHTFLSTQQLQVTQLRSNDKKEIIIRKILQLKEKFSFSSEGQNLESSLNKQVSVCRVCLITILQELVMSLSSMDINFNLFLLFHPLLI